MKYPVTKLAVVVLGASILLGACAPVITSSLREEAELGERFEYRITAKRNPTSFDAELPPPEGLAIDRTTGVISGIPRVSGSFNFNITASNKNGSDNKTLNLNISEPPHDVVFDKELIIRDPALLQRSAHVQPGGDWHIKTLMQKVAGEGVDVEQFARQWFQHWARNININGDAALPRNGVQQVLQTAWDDNRFRLIAIVNRMDLTKTQARNEGLEVTSMGEGRFVYEVTSSNGSAQEFTLIFEYGLPVLEGENDMTISTRSWARRWHNLGSAGITDEAFEAELHSMTLDFSKTGQLNQLRTNEILGGGVWQLREFAVTGNTLQQRTVAQTPRTTLKVGENERDLFDRYITRNRNAILAGSHNFADQAPDLLAAKSDVRGDWSSQNNGSREGFIIEFNTCGGCHDLPGTGFQHIQRASINVAARLSPLLRGEIRLEQSLPSCSPLAGEVPPLWCGEKTWNERLMRESVLAFFAQDSVIPAKQRVLQSLRGEQDIATAILTLNSRQH